jgi:hypothetical protein
MPSMARKERIRKGRKDLWHADQRSFLVKASLRAKHERSAGIPEQAGTPTPPPRPSGRACGAL